MPLEIAPEKVAHIILKAREFEAGDEAWSDEDDEPADIEINEEDLESAHEEDPAYQEVAGFIDMLNDDEQAHLVALTWIGRGTYEAEEFDEAVETAVAEATGLTSAYLLGMPLLPDYLEEGLEKMGFSVGEVENDVM